ncbi:MAG: CheY-P-specific phosphatase CheC [Conexibacter sp.]|jgi:chemotaxis protein CheC|nr:CheY-P-specific phosphatase CheC [Conexibacter sp.]MCZ4494913.1 CheY-P-specific phosphatase CheC [Conexibacter sp.]MDX6731236.1 chemotaxis protein CheC [Baekduia sp.]
MTAFTDLQLDALRELANIGSGNAGTALGSMLGKTVDISVPTAAVLPLADAVAIAGRPDELRHGIVVPVVGDMEAIVLLLFPEADARTLCGIYGIEPSTPDGRSMLGEVGNILGTNYINVLAQMVSMTLEPRPPQVVEDMLGAILESVLLGRGEDVDHALVMDSSLMVEGEQCSLSFLLLPNHGGVRHLLERLGL